ncbi:Protein kinase domain-containing protein [Mycena indigotica]|uniref:Protein kinase domain-containing protein n=1 Tax=Mycena indigotica TaxID=2126181 RepID=A0A8H6W4D8_9AGAR|nr:Protein kinase domain-containing protein [Mycena indigotica]KAF7298854.1 Protein kinase domain-containing protein [Mycena indigotica]
MEYPQPPASADGSTDVFSLSDQVLSEKLQFIEEIGFGNWGSVWLCRPKDGLLNNNDGVVTLQESKIAVKLVHRSKTSTTAARVRSLWNEMKIVRAFKTDPHPSIIPFHSFIITPSYALITMAYLPTLIPVEVDESKAREWFHFLLSGTEFLHKRGVVHNDIKPANILLSDKNIPVLVDFGFAEKYDLKSSTAFHSNLSYGTPEYLSPERARGLPHDTRKSDVWSLGITFFEILIGRTPFEHSDTEQFSTKEDLEKYWARTLRGRWVGTWKMSKGMERLLRRMISPNADLRCNATDAMNDSYWRAMKESNSNTLHRRSASYTSSVVFENDLSKLVSPQSSRAKENSFSPPGLERSLTKSKSQPKVTSSRVPVKTQKRVPVPATADLSPIKASPPTSPPASATRPPLAALSGRTRENLPQHTRAPSRDTIRVKPLSELTANRKRDSVRDRVREWEREKERLREMERLDELERDRDSQREKEREESERRQKALVARERQRDKENQKDADQPVMLPTPPSSTPAPAPRVSSPENVASSRNNSFAIQSFKHSIKLSFGWCLVRVTRRIGLDVVEIDKTLQFYKNTTSLGQATSRNVSTRTLPQELQEDISSSQTPSLRRESWEDELLEREAKSSLPVVRHAVHNERVAADNQADRMAIWMRNVEQVVEDARQTFASSSNEPATLPSLPAAPLSRPGHVARQPSYRSSSRLPRRILAASQIFSDSPDSTFNMSSMDVAANSTVAKEEEPQLPGKPQRRATMSAEMEAPATTDNIETGSPSRRKEKSRSHGDLLERRITSIAVLEKELAKSTELLPSPRLATPRLADVLDRSLLVASPTKAFGEDNDDERSSTAVDRSRSFDELTSSPYHVQPYPARKANGQPAPIPDSPSLRRLEGVYDRFLMATTGVKRVGKGYQSDNAGPVAYTVGPSSAVPQRNQRAFHSARRAMRPPVSSEDADNRLSASVDELGFMTYAGPGTVSPREGNSTMTLMRKAFKAIVPGKTVSRRISRAM